MTYRKHHGRRRTRRNPSGGDLGMLAIAGAAAAGGYLLLKGHTTPAPVTTTSAPVGYSPPADLLGPMEHAWYIYGSPTGDYQRWVQAMQSVAPQSATAWVYVYRNWLAVYNQTGGWPSNDQLTTWLTYAVNQHI